MDKQFILFLHIQGPVYPTWRMHPDVFTTATACAGAGEHHICAGGIGYRYIEVPALHDSDMTDWLRAFPDMVKGGYTRV